MSMVVMIAMFMFMLLLMMIFFLGICRTVSIRTRLFIWLIDGGRMRLLAAPMMVRRLLVTGTLSFSICGDRPVAGSILTLFQ